MSLRVMCLTPWFPDKPGDRWGNFVFDSLMAVRAQGVRVCTFVASPWRPGGRNGPEIGTFPDDLKIEATSFPSVPRFWLRGLSNHLRLRSLFASCVEHARRNQVQIVHAHTEDFAELAAEIATSLGIASIVTIHGINTSKRATATAAQRRYLGKNLNAVDRVVLVGEPLLSFVKSFTNREDHFRVVHNGFTLDAIPRSSEILTTPVIRFISVSNLDKGKGIHIALEALATLSKQGLKKWQYDVVGDGAFAPELKKLAARLEVEHAVRFLGAVEHVRVPALLAQADIFVLPSYREAFGIAYLEAMSAGLLAIGIEGQGSSAFIRHGVTGLLARPCDPFSLAECIANAVQDPSCARRIAAAGKKSVDTDFTWQQHAKVLLDVYRELA